MAEAVEKLKKGERATLVSAFISMALLIMKGGAGLLTGSVVLVTSALDSMSDIIGMSASWFGFRISQKEPRGRFPYGYYKAESVATLLVSFFILYAAFRLLLEGYSRLGEPPSLSMPALALSVAFVSIFISFGLSRFLLREGRKINSQLLITSSRERLADVGATVAVFMAVATSILGIPYVESVVSMAISLLILRLGIISVRDSVFALMDIGAGHDKGTTVKNIIRNTEGVEDFGNLRMRKAGPFIFGEATIMIRGHTHVDRAHRIADEIEQRIKKRIGEVVEFVIHVEPYKGRRFRIAVPVDEDRGLGSPPSEEFAKAGWILFMDVEDGRIARHFAIKSPGSLRAQRARLRALNLIVDQKADALATRNIGEISFHTLRDHMVDIYRIRGGKPEQIADRFIKGKLEILTDHKK